MDTIAPEGETLPPYPNDKRTSGRPKKKQYRKRARTACDPEVSAITCSRCGNRGHNVRTCIAREENERDLRENGEENVGVTLDLL